MCEILSSVIRYSYTRDDVKEKEVKFLEKKRKDGSPDIRVTSSKKRDFLFLERKKQNRQKRRKLSQFKERKLSCFYGSSSLNWQHLHKRESTKTYVLLTRITVEQSVSTRLYWCLSLCLVVQWKDLNVPEVAFLYPSLTYRRADSVNFPERTRSQTYAHSISPKRFLFSQTLWSFFWNLVNFSLFSSKMKWIRTFLYPDVFFFFLPFFCEDVSWMLLFCTLFPWETTSSEHFWWIVGA